MSGFRHVVGGEYEEIRNPNALNKGHARGVEATEPLNFELEPIRTPKEILDVLIRLDRSNDRLADGEKWRKPLCYIFEPNWIDAEYYEQLFGGDFEDGPFYYGMYAPILHVIFAVDETIWFRGTVMEPMRWAEHHEGVLRIDYSDREGARGEIENKVMQIVRAMVTELDEDNDLSEKKFWGIPLLLEGLDARLRVARFEYFASVRAQVEQGTQFRRRLIRATYVKEALARLLREGWARGVVLGEPVLGVMANWDIFPDILSVERQLPRVENVVDRVSHALEPIRIGEGVRGEESEIIYPTAMGKELTGLMEAVERALQESKIGTATVASPASSRALLEIEVLRNLVGGTGGSAGE